MAVTYGKPAYKYQRSNTGKRARSKSKATVPRNLRQYVRKAITNMAEMKMFGVNGYDDAVSTAYSSIIDLSQVVVGTGGANRIGNKIRLHKIEYKILFTSTGAPASGIIPVYRAVVFTCPKGNSDAGTDALLLDEANDAAAPTTNQLVSVLRPFNRDTNTVFADHLMEVQPASDSYFTETSTACGSIKLDRVLEFDDDGLDAKNNNVRIWLCGRDRRNIGGTATLGEVHYQCQIYFTDI